MQTAMHVEPDRVGIKHTFDSLIGESIRTLRKRFQPTHPADWKARGAKWLQYHYSVQPEP